MKLKFTMAAMLMSFASVAVAGPGCNDGHSEQVMSCAEGTVWDSHSQSCVPQITS